MLSLIFYKLFGMKEVLLFNQFSGKTVKTFAKPSKTTSNWYGNVSMIDGKNPIRLNQDGTITNLSSNELEYLNWWPLDDAEQITVLRICGAEPFDLKKVPREMARFGADGS